MNPTRRVFLQGLAVTALTSKLSLMAFAQHQPEEPLKTSEPESHSILDGASRETFEPWIGGSFRMSVKNQQLGSATLISVSEVNPEVPFKPSVISRLVGVVPKSPTGPSITSFSLRFRRLGKALPQDTYTMAHNWLGTFPLFLVPSGGNGLTTTYIATFSMLDRIETNH